MPRKASWMIVGLLTAVLFPVRPMAAEPTDPTKNYMGINATFLSDYIGENPCVDMMKEGRSWENYNASAPATVDSENWPTQDCSNIMFGTDNPLGVYKLFFEGQAASVASLYYAGTSTVSNLHYDAATNTSTADVTLNSVTTDGLHFQGTKRTATGAANTGIRNVRLYRPGYPTDGSVACSNEWKTIMRKFHAIRFMDWIMTSGNPLVTWGQRVNPFKAPSHRVTINGNTGDLGAAMELCIQACNETNCDLWLNIPVMVDDDYITKTAQLIRYGSDGRNPYTSQQADPVYPPLNAGLKVYLEYGNEIWNTSAGFQCFYWIKHITDSISAATVGTHPIVFDGVRDENYSIARYAAWKTVDISTIFRGVFGDAAMMTRVRPVLMGQIGGNWFNPQQLPWLEAFYSTSRPSTDPYPNTNPEPVSYYIYASGGSGYYGVYNCSTDPNTFFAGANYPDSSYAQLVASDAVWAGNYGLKRIAYEGGMGLDCAEMTSEQMLTLNDDQRMKDLTVAYHNIWSSCAGDLLVYFEDVHNGNEAWEFTNSVYNLDSPKLQAIDKLRDTLGRAPVSLGGVVPCTTVAQTATAMVVNSNGTYRSTTNGEGVLNLNSFSGNNQKVWLAAPFTSSQSGWYRLSVRCQSSSGTVNLWVNGTNAATRTTPNPLGNTAYVTVQLKGGLNVVRLVFSSGGGAVRSIMMTPSDTVVSVAPRQVASFRPSALTVKSVSGSILAHIAKASSADDQFAVHDVEGRCIMKGKIGSAAKDLVLPRLAPGAYLLRLKYKRVPVGHSAQDVVAMVVR
jgi:hypothetical protein